MDHSDRSLVVAAKRDQKQFDALYRRYFKTVYNYFWYRLDHDDDVAEDLTQDTFVRAFRRLDTYQVTEASYLSYLLTIAHNLLVNYYRRAKPVPLDSIPDIPVETWGQLEEDDTLDRLWQAIQTLSPTDRDVLYLKYGRGYTMAEIADITNKSENAVKLAVSRARKRLAASDHVQLIAQFGEINRSPSAPRYKEMIS